METIKDRLQQLYRELNLSQREFEANIGVSNGCLAHVTDRLTKHVIDKITTTYPTISTDWLLYGQGAMHKIPPTLLVANDKVDAILAEVAKQREIIARFQHQIDLCQAHIDILLNTLRR